MLKVAAVVCVGLAVNLTAQQPSAFAKLDFPAGVPAGVNSLGKLVHLVDNGTLFVFSASLRNWTSMPVGPSATMHATNDIVLVRDAASWTAFSASRGRFAPLPVSQTAQLVNPLAQANDSVLLVRDGTSLHTFSGFTGRWVTRAITATTNVTAQRHVAVLADGAQCSGFDAFTGQWHDLQADGPVTRLSVDGVCGLATSANTAYGFSALQSAWATAPAVANASWTMFRNDDWAVLHDGVVALGYSGLTNSFSSTTTGALSARTGDDLLAILTAPGLVHAFSAFTGTWSVAPLAATASLRVTTAAALIVDGPQLLAYSSPRSQWVPLALDSVGESVAGSILAVHERGTGRAHLFSALTGSWHAAPVDANPGLPRIATTGALLATPTGAYAFSSRTGAFVALFSAGVALECNDSSSPMLAWDAANLHCFDGRRDRWLSVPRTGSGACNVQIWRTNAFAIDGNDVIGFSCQGGAVARTTLQETVVAFRANSESASLVTAHSVLGLSGTPEPECLSQFPDFRRVAVVGAPFRLHLRLLATDVALLGYGPVLPTPAVLPPLGTLLLDTQAAVVQFLAPEVDADRAVFAARIPEDPALHFASVWFQALVVPAVGSPYLTDASVLWIG